MPNRGPSEPERQLALLRQAVAASPRRVREIEVGIPLSILLGRLRPSVSCGGCTEPLAYEGIPARTNAGLREPFRLHYEGSEPS